MKTSSSKVKPSAVAAAVKPINSKPGNTKIVSKPVSAKTGSAKVVSSKVVTSKALNSKAILSQRGESQLVDEEHRSEKGAALIKSVPTFKSAPLKNAPSRPVALRAVPSNRLKSGTPLKTIAARSGNDLSGNAALSFKGAVAVKIVAEESVVKARPKLFNEGDKVVYPGHGVGVINGVQTRSIGGTTQHIYEITIIESGMKIMVPVFQAEAVGLRRVVDKKTVDEVYAILKERDFKIDTQTWNRRFREYSQKIKTGSVFEIAEVLRDLSVLGVDKQLSFGEKKMLDTAQNLLVSEIAIAKARPAEKVVSELKEIFAS